MATSDDIKKQLTDSELNWLKVQKIITGTYQWVFWSKNLINRREYDGELPPGVLEERRKVDLYKMAEQMNRIEQNTADVPWLGKFIANIFKSGAGEAEKKYPSRKK